MNSLFITGTDTSVGKTHVAVSLLKGFSKQGYSTFAMKPIASGSQQDEAGRLVNADALALQKHSSIKKPYQQVNPVAFLDPIAPHLAAKKQGVYLSVSNLVDLITESLVPEADINIVEGVGGWSVPLNDHELFSQAIAVLKIPAILVVGIKLGCINHAILTAQSISQMQVPLVGWIANCLTPDIGFSDEIVATLSHWLSVPCVGLVRYGLPNH